MGLVLVDNPAPAAGGEPSVTYIAVPDDLPVLAQAREVQTAMAGHGDFVGQAAGEPGAIDVMPTRIAADNPQLAVMLQAIFATDGEPPEVVSTDDLMAEYHDLSGGQPVDTAEHVEHASPDPLATLTVEQVRDVAKALDLPGRSTATGDELRAAIGARVGRRLLVDLARAARDDS